MAGLMTCMYEVVLRRIDGTVSRSVVHKGVVGRGIFVLKAVSRRSSIRDPGT